MVLFWAAIQSNLVSHLRFPLWSHVHVDLSAIPSICLLKYPFNCFSSHFRVLAVVLTQFLFTLQFVVVHFLVFVSNLSLQCIILIICTHWVFPAGVAGNFYWRSNDSKSP